MLLNIAMHQEHPHTKFSLNFVHNMNNLVRYNALDPCLLCGGTHDVCEFLDK